MKNKFTSKLRLGAALTALVAMCLMASTANAAATLVIVNFNAAGVGFNDPTVVVPVGGNPGTTLGQQRLNAFQFAANKWGSTLTSTQTIYIGAQFTPLSCTATGAVLGSAGAVSVFADFPNAPILDTWYPGALADKLSGEDQDPGFIDISARFNSNLGNPGCLTGVPFYYGFDNNHGTSVDLVTVLLHEFGHGLGFQTFTDGTDGTFLGAPFLPAVWDHLLHDNSTGLNWAQMTDAQRIVSGVNDQNLVWYGPVATAGAPLVLKGLPQVVVSGPAAGAASGTYPAGTAAFGNPLTTPGIVGDIMPLSTAASGADGCIAFSAVDKLAVTGNIALISRGTCGFAVKVKNAQNAGAIGVIIANNAAGVAPPGLGGADPTITIPTGSITLEAATKVRAALTKRSRTKSGVSGTLGLNPSLLAGTDAAGFVKMYAPNPYQPGSSVSHWDVSAFSNLLMEPAINGDLTHEVTVPYDLTFALLKDIGWN